MTITRKIAAAAVAAAAIVAPGAAQAKPVDIHAPLARAAAAQDLRSPDAREAARTSSLAGTTSPKQDLRSPDARDAAIPRRRAIDAPGATAVDSATRPAPGALPGSPTWPVNPEPITPAPAAQPTGDSGGLDWAPIGLGLAGALFGIGGLASLGIRRARRVRVAA